MATALAFVTIVEACRDVFRCGYFWSRLCLAVASWAMFGRGASSSGQLHIRHVVVGTSVIGLSLQLYRSSQSLPLPRGAGGGSFSYSTVCSGDSAQR